MKNATQFLPGFNIQTLRKAPRSALQTLQDNIKKVIDLGIVYKSSLVVETIENAFGKKLLCDNGL